MSAALRRIGARLAFLALAIQVALPLLLAVEIRALAASEQQLPVASLCLHDGASLPSDPGPTPGCGPMACPLCATLAIALALAAPPAATPTPPSMATAAPWPKAPPALHHGVAAPPYRSRAPPTLG